MFTGIITATATVIEKTDSSLTIARPEDWTDIAINSSVAVSGACLSITKFDQDTITFDVVPETWQCTNLSQLESGNLVNLEQALPASARLDGHIVQGHVEGVGKLISLEKQVLTIEITKELIKYCVHKGAIALDGISLTIASVSGTTITVALVPHTVKQTRFGQLQPGDLINVETDIVGRYVYAFTHGS